MKSYSKRILSTRPLSAALVEEAKANNIYIDEIAFIKTDALIDEALKLRLNELAGKEITVVFTSMTAIEILAKHVSNIAQWKIYCIGNTTKQLIDTSFPEANVKGFAKDAFQLADIIIANNENQVTFFCGDIRREELPDKLKSAGIAVQEIVVYKTTETPILVDKGYNGIMFFSPSGVRSFFRINVLVSGTILFSIGNTTASEIKKHTDNNIIISNEPGKEELVKQVIKYYQELPQIT